MAPLFQDDHLKIDADGDPDLGFDALGDVTSHIILLARPLYNPHKVFYHRYLR